MAFYPRGKNWGSFKKKKEFKEELLAIDRVTRVTAWGRQLKFRAVMVVWDWKWKVWLWTWKSWEVVDAISMVDRDVLNVPINPVAIQNIAHSRSAW